jgi:hypothetical protein
MMTIPYCWCRFDRYCPQLQKASAMPGFRMLAVRRHQPHPPLTFCVSGMILCAN